MLRGFITFIIVFVLLMVVLGALGGNAGPYEILLGAVVALVVAWVAVRRRRSSPT